MISLTVDVNDRESVHRLNRRIRCVEHHHRKYPRLPKNLNFFGRILNEMRVWDVKLPVAQQKHNSTSHLPCQDWWPNYDSCMDLDNALQALIANTFQPSTPKCACSNIHWFRSYLSSSFISIISSRKFLHSGQFSHFSVDKGRDNQPIF